MTRGERRRLRPVVVALALALSFASLGATCVDGVTPDCAGDAGCGPTNVDAALDTSSQLPEGSADSSADGAEADAPVDAPDDVEDAGDEI